MVAPAPMPCSGTSRTDEFVRTLGLGLQAALFYVVLGDNKKLLALAKADSGFLNQRALSGAEGSLDGKTGRGKQLVWVSTQ